MLERLVCSRSAKTGTTVDSEESQDIAVAWSSKRIYPKLTSIVAIWP